MKKRKRLYIKSQERPEGRRLKSYRVRCAKTVSFYVDVDAYTPQEAEFICDDYFACDRPGCKSWSPGPNSISTPHVSFSFEAEKE